MTLLAWLLLSGRISRLSSYRRTIQGTAFPTSPTILRKDIKTLYRLTREDKLFVYVVYSVVPGPPLPHYSKYVDYVKNIYNIMANMLWLHVISLLPHVPTETSFSERGIREIMRGLFWSLYRVTRLFSNLCIWSHIVAA